MKEAEASWDLGGVVVSRKPSPAGVTWAISELLYPLPSSFSTPRLVPEADRDVSLRVWELDDHTLCKINIVTSSTTPEQVTLQYLQKHDNLGSAIRHVHHHQEYNGRYYIIYAQQQRHARHFILSPVDESDAEQLVRKCDFPAMRDNPLHLLMFPHSTKDTEEAEIQWTIEGLQKTLRTQPAGFRKVCLEDGAPVGFAGWSLEQTTAPEKDKRTEEPREPTQKGNWHPETLDVHTWIRISKMLREEKIRVLRNRKNIWRLNLISVDPIYQCQGIGSLLLEWGCKDADSHGRDCFLIASPAGLPLYKKFGFEVVGEVHTLRGTFTSMLRTSR